AVLGIDIYLGRHWLDPALPVGKKQKPRHVDQIATNDPALARSLLVRRSSAAMLGRLLWQHWRQTRWLMVLIIVVGLPAAVAVVGVPLWIARVARDRWNPIDPIPFILAAWASIAGSCVFLSDQEQRRYKFFAEHNVPPRLVWLSRQVPWLTAL